jgi:hypothetical protein
LDNQKLYDENPNWKDFQLPPSFAERPPQAPRAEATPARPPESGRGEQQVPSFTPPPPPQPPPSRQVPEQPPVQQPSAGTQELIAQSIRESMRAQAQMMDRFAREMRELSARNAAPPQFIPMPAPPQPREQAPPAFSRYHPPPLTPQTEPLPSLEEPIVPSPGRPEAGIPRFARDHVEEEEQIEPVRLEEPVAKTHRAALDEQSVAGAEAPAVAGESAAETYPEMLLGGEAEPGEPKKDLRQRLREFLKRIRERLEQRRTKKAEEPSQPVSAAPSESKSRKVPGAKGNEATPVLEPSGGSASLVNYLEELTEYLPEKRKSSFHHSDARLKIEYIKSKLQGRSGIRNQIETKFAPRVDGAATGPGDSAGGGSSLDPEKIAETFDFMKNLASFHPDKTLGTMLQSKMNAVLRKIRE